MTSAPFQPLREIEPRQKQSDLRILNTAMSWFHFRQKSLREVM